VPTALVKAGLSENAEAVETLKINKFMDNKKYSSPLQSIRKKCLDCMCGSANEVKLCTGDGVQSTFCALYPYRLGKRPAESKKRIFTDEQRLEIADRFKKAREAKRAPAVPV